MINYLDVIIAAILGILFTAETLMHPTSRVTREYEAMRALSAILQDAYAQRAQNSSTTGSAGLDENDGVTVSFNTSSEHTTLEVYDARPLGSTTLPTPTGHYLNLPVTVNGSSTPTAIFISPSGSVTDLSGWSDGTSALSAISCTTLTFAAQQVTLTMDCTTGALTLSGP
jgi:hypothetical protein